MERRGGANSHRRAQGVGHQVAALAKLLVGRPENAIKNHWHATLWCKTHKTRGEAPKISALKRYQMSLAQSAENGAAARPRAEPTRSHATATTTATNATTATTVDGAENLGGMSRSARNSRYSRAQREEIEQGLTRMRADRWDKLKAVWQIADDTATEDDRGASADLKTNDKATAAAATTEKSPASGDDVAFVTGRPEAGSADFAQTSALEAPRRGRRSRRRSPPTISFASTRRRSISYSGKRR